MLNCRCIYFYPQKTTDKNEWVIGNVGFSLENIGISVYDIALVRQKQSNGCFLGIPNKSYKKDGVERYVKYFSFNESAMHDSFQEEGKKAIEKFCREKGIRIPPELNL